MALNLVLFATAQSKGEIFAPLRSAAQLCSAVSEMPVIKEVIGVAAPSAEVHPWREQGSLPSDNSN